MDKNSSQTDLLILLLPHLGTKTEHLIHSSNFPMPLKTPAVSPQEQTKFFRVHLEHKNRWKSACGSSAGQ